MGLSFFAPRTLFHCSFRLDTPIMHKDRQRTREGGKGYEQTERTDIGTDTYRDRIDRQSEEGRQKEPTQIENSQGQGQGRTLYLHCSWGTRLEAPQKGQEKKKKDNIAWK